MRQHKHKSGGTTVAAALPEAVFPLPGHDHERCAAEAIVHAEQVCRQRGQKLTPIRRNVLNALLASHRPLGAYDVLEELAHHAARPAPITVYRALDFLIANGLVHRIESRNAFIACAHNHDQSAAVAFLILAPGLALILTVLACTLLGDALRDRLAGEEMLTLRSRS